jgi:hypothetical protein
MRSLLARLGATPAQVGMGYGVIAGAVVVSDLFKRGGWGGAFLIAGLVCGLLGAMVRINELNDTCDGYEKLLRKHCIDKSEVPPVY